jgi:hypothetical protein
VYGLLTTISLLLGISFRGFAQGRVDFRNGAITFPTPGDRRCYLSYPSVPLTGITFVAGLWYVEGTDLALLSSFTDGAQVGRTFPFRPPTTSLPGTWTVGSGDPSFELPGVTIGETAVLQVRVWDTAKFRSFADAVVGGEYAASCPFLYTVPPNGSTPDKYYMDNLRAFGGGANPFCVPEPSGWSLLVAGALGLLLIRRRASR